ncbi:protein CAJ1-like [Cornus florida]|uniref:protein CAJ1-like n=1 Tax=Cornus florida TaxID=4283 RepID=UPI00289F14F4|nr:protein CAJ1-like [Cornus florida]XP_059631034.1 protein CAJ1-like [Cornus florida]
MEAMDKVDHYRVLGLPSGEEGAMLSEEEIKKAYRLKALELHPDKRRDDPDAHANFQQLNTSYGILKDKNTRKLFDNFLLVEHDLFQQEPQHYNYDENSQYYNYDENPQHYDYDYVDYENLQHVFCHIQKGKKSKSRDLKYDLIGWIILAVGIAAWVGIAKSHVPSPPR